MKTLKTISILAISLFFLQSTAQTFSDNLQNDTLNKFPSKWNSLKGTAQVYKVNGKKAIRMGKGTIISPKIDTKDYLGGSFKIEFDLYFDEVRRAITYQRYMIRLWPGISAGKADGLSFRPLRIYRHGATLQVRDKTKQKRGNEYRNYLKELETKEPVWRHVVINYKQGKLSFFMESKLVLTIPNYGPINPSKLSVEAYSNDGQVELVKAIDNIYLNASSISNTSVENQDIVINNGEESSNTELATNKKPNETTSSSTNQNNSKDPEITETPSKTPDFIEDKTNTNSNKPDYHDTIDTSEQNPETDETQEQNSDNERSNVDSNIPKHPEYIYNDSDKYLMSAGLLDGNNNAIFFNGPFFYKYNADSNSSFMGVLNLNGWSGIPMFVDAAFKHPSNGMAYIFRGTKFYTFNLNLKSTILEGVIGDKSFKGVPSVIDAALYHPSNNKVYFFKGESYFRYDLSNSQVDKTGKIGIDGWKGVPANVNLALLHNNGKAYFFKDDHYYRFDFNKDHIDKVGVIGRDGWAGLFNDIDAINNKDIFSGRYYTYFTTENYKTGNLAGFLKAFPAPVSQFLGRRLNVQVPFFWTEHLVTETKTIGNPNYDGCPSNPDAVLTHPINNDIYFFKNDKYYRYNKSLNKITESGIIGKDYWYPLPKNLDAGFTYDMNTTYFFKGDSYYKFDHTLKTIQKIGKIKDKWPGIPNYVDGVSWAIQYAEQGITQLDSQVNEVGIVLAFIKNSSVYIFDVLENKVIKRQSLSSYMTPDNQLVIKPKNRE